MLSAVLDLTGGGKISSAPRYLTNDEIKTIISKIPYGPYGTANRQSTIFARQSMMSFETFKLRYIQLSPLALEEYANLYTSNLNFSKIEYGTPVGAISAEAASQQSSQNAMNSSKVESSRASTNMVEAFDEILEVRNRKNPGMYIHYKDNPTVETIMREKRLHLENVTVNDLAITQAIESVDLAYPNDNFPSWYSMYKSTILLGGPIPRFTWMLQLRINTDLMYQNKILPRDIAAAIERSKPSGELRSVYSPLFKDETGAYILFDIYVASLIKSKNVKESKLPEDDKVFMKLNNVVKPGLSSMIVKGLNGIFRVSKQIVTINYSLYNEINLNRYFPEKINEYLIKLNLHYMGLNLITTDQIIDMLTTVGMIEAKMTNSIPALIEYSDMEIYVVLPADKPSGWKNDVDYTPINYVRYVINKDNEEKESYQKEQQAIKTKIYNEYKNETNPARAKELLMQSNRIKIYKEPSMIYKKCNQIYVETEGYDFSNVIKMSGIDMTRSHSNSLIDILKYFGIEALRTHIIRELIFLIRSSGGDAYIDPRHISLIADWMTMFGYLTPFTLKGMKYHKLGSLANAALRAPTQAIQEEAMLNKIDYLGNVSSAITVGNPIPLGTGMVNIITDQAKIKKQLATRPQKPKNKISTSVTANLISLLLQGDFLDPKDRSTDEIIGIADVESSFNLPTTFMESSVILSDDPMELSFSLESLIPTMSEEYRYAYDNARVCQPAPIQTQIIEGNIPGENPMNPISPPIIVIDPTLRSVDVVIERPPEIETLEGNSSFLDDFLS